MIVKNGKCYPDNPVPMMKIVGAQPCGGYDIRVLFNNSEERIFDGSTILAGEAFKPLRDEKAFRNFKLDYETLTWQDGDLDVAPEFVYANSRPVVR